MLLQRYVLSVAIVSLLLPNIALNAVAREQLLIFGLEEHGL